MIFNLMRHHDDDDDGNLESNWYPQQKRHSSSSLTPCAYEFRLVASASSTLDENLRLKEVTLLAEIVQG
jgi:hypothetical protein